MPVDYLALIAKHTRGEDPRTVHAFVVHSALVARKALAIAHDHLVRNPDARIDVRLLEEIAMLHDIGIFRTDTPALFTRGEGPYITHLSRGAEILASEGLPLHARAARTHSGIPKEVIVAQGLPLPHIDHFPASPEEEILYLADKFYSKVFRELFRERSVAEIRAYLQRYGEDALRRFDALAETYGVE